MILATLIRINAQAPFICSVSISAFGFRTRRDWPAEAMNHGAGAETAYPQGVHMSDTV